MAVVFQSLHGTGVLKFQGTSLMRMFDLYFSKRWSFLFPGYLLDVEWTEWIVFFESVPRLFASGFPGLVCLSENPISPSLAETQPNYGTIFTIATAFLSSLPLVFLWIVALCRLFVRLFVNLVVPHKAIACNCLSNSIYTVVEEWYQDHFCPWYFFSSTHFDLVIRLAQKVWRQCVLVFAHDLGLRGGNCNGLFANTGFLLSTDNKYLFFLQRHSFPSDSWPLLLFQFSRAWRQSFAIEVSELYSSSPLSSIFENWTSTSSDEFPCRTIPIRFWVARTHKVSICTDFRECHPMESSSLIIKISSHLVSNSWMLSSWRVTENKSA